MSSLPKFLCAALLGLLVLTAAPAAQAQTYGPPAWGPPVPQGTQFYYIPEIDGYYDLYAQQYIVFQNGQWVALPPSYYDPYPFHPVILDYRGRQPWVFVNAHRDRYPRRVVVVQPRRAIPPGQVRRAYRDGYQQGRYEDNRGHGHDNNNGRGRSRRD
ncbi:hypothetical protein [Hymenobacter armeniacus]|uniref:WG repeat-containing protein n=1 Tax=Hymenobacter armeniacus TaxID=2771358 RepID=A0ABR8JSX3_9BACT|nr:hypothetical protein [Hymenobacter armeniacus]MBD2723082.1 hypothetical protein [Hymenobacter armeniacus]